MVFFLQDLELIVIIILIVTDLSEEFKQHEYLHWVLLGFSLLFGNSVSVDKFPNQLSGFKIIMSFTWDQFHSDCRQVSNTSVICADGVIFTHKLVLAHISNLMKNTLKEIPPADEATIYLKDFSKEDVELFMSEMSLGQKSRNTDLLLLFGNKSVSDDFPTSSTRKEVKVKYEDDCDAEEHLFSDTFSNHAEFQSDANYEELDDTTEEFS